MRNLALTLFCWSAVATAPCRSSHAADGPLAGEQIYRDQCARCHGGQGEGTSDHQKLLAGDLSVAQLADVIARTMPEDNAGSLSSGEARAVAEHIHDAFYSAIARARNQPPRIELSRLTIRQYRHAVADVIGSFRKPTRWGDVRGLSGEYFRGRRVGDRRSLAVSRTDLQIEFDFGPGAPAPEIAEPREFSIRWQGSLLAPETGEYEFVARTEHAARLWINDLEQPLVDAWVKSGDETDHGATLFLVAGQAYPLRLEFTKAKQGVDDSKKQKETPPSAPASIALLWRRPHGVLAPIPPRQLSPDSAPEAYVCDTPFPPDDRSFGWIRGASVSKSWDEASTAAALEAASYVAAHLNELAGARDDAPDRSEKLQAFCLKFAERAFRRPLSDEQTQLFVTRQFAEETPLETSVKRVVLLALKSPRFLFREMAAQPDAYDVAARLSLGLWDSIPDAELLTAAAQGRLETREQVAKQAERMLGDRRAQAKLREFLLTWLRADGDEPVGKDPAVYPEFDETIAADLRTSLELLLDDVLWSSDSDYRRLLLSEDVFLNRRLAAIYGVEAPAVAGFAKSRIDDGRRAGVLTHPYLMAHFASSSESSPIHRGVFLARGILGQSLRQPPEAVAPLAPELHPDLTTRERVALQTKAATCMSCHGIINPLGFTLERFDAVGRYRETDRGKPVDDSGSYQTRSGKSVSLRGARELAEFLAGSEEAHSAFIEQLFHHLVQQPVRAYGPAALEKLRSKFAGHGFQIQKLAVEVMAASALAGRTAEDAASEAPRKPPREE